MALRVGMDIEAKGSISSVDGGLFVSSLSHNSPTDNLKNDIIREWFISSNLVPIVVAPLTTAYIISNTGSTLGIVSFTSRGNYWVSGQFTANITGTVATIHVLGSTYMEEAGSTYAVTSTYFIGSYAFTVTAGWVYALTVSLSGSASASGLSLSPLGAANLVSAPGVTLILEKLIGITTVRHQIGSAIWLSNTGVTLLGITLTRSTISSVAGVMSHGESAFTASGTLTTIQIRSHLGSTLFVVSVPTIAVGTADRGLLTLTVSIQ